MISTTLLYSAAFMAALAPCSCLALPAVSPDALSRNGANGVSVSASTGAGTNNNNANNAGGTVSKALHNQILKGAPHFRTTVPNTAFIVDGGAEMNGASLTAPLSSSVGSTASTAGYNNNNINNNILLSSSTTTTTGGSSGPGFAAENGVDLRNGNNRHLRNAIGSLNADSLTAAAAAQPPQLPQQILPQRLSSQMPPQMPRQQPSLRPLSPLQYQPVAAVGVARNGIANAADPNAYPPASNGYGSGYANGYSYSNAANAATTTYGNVPAAANALANAPANVKAKPAATVPGWPSLLNFERPASAGNTVGLTNVGINSVGGGNSVGADYNYNYKHPSAATKDMSLLRGKGLLNRQRFVLTNTQQGSI